VLQSWLGSFEDDRTRQFVAGSRIGDLVDLLQDSSRTQRDQEWFDAMDDLSPLGRLLIPPKMIFSGKRVR